MTWSKEPPTEPGYYWARQRTVPHADAEVVAFALPGSVDDSPVQVTGTKLDYPADEFYWGPRVSPPPFDAARVRRRA